jgi:hypothetical protein
VSTYTPSIDFRGARGSNTGDQFHELWALQQILDLLRPETDLVGQIAHGASFEEILDAYPDLEKEDIRQAIEYAAWLTQS